MEPCGTPHITGIASDIVLFPVFHIVSYRWDMIKTNAAFFSAFIQLYFFQKDLMIYQIERFAKIYYE